MAFSVKSKIRLGTLFLFILLLLVGGIGIYFTVTLKQDAREVLKDNYESISYCHTIQQQLDSLSDNSEQRFLLINKMVALQERNITEEGEEEATGDIKSLLQKIQLGDTTFATKNIIQYRLQQILKVNMDAIYRKNMKAEQTAERAMTFMIALTGVIFLVAFTFSVNFPSIVADPIRKLSDAINEIANKNYKHRIYLDSKSNEFSSVANAFNNMAERLQYFESSNLNKLMFEKARAESVINSLKDASIGIDGNGLVLFANSEALQLLGLKSADIVGKSSADVAKRNDLFNYLVNNDTSSPFKIVVDNKENFFIKEVLEVGQDEAKSKVIVLRNITSFKELDVAKTNFIATISHELKTPLAASDFSLKLLEDKRIGNLTDEQKELVNSLKQDNQRILKIVSELLNLSQVETGKINLNIQSVNPQLIVNRALEATVSAAREKNITIHQKIEDGLPEVKADPEKTAWVLNNLISNAVKHSQQNSTIEIMLSRNENGVIFSVHDTGTGIAKEYIPKLFDRYFQIPGSNAKGTGLGLAISKDFIESQHGSIWVESEINKGSTFSFAMPSNQGKDQY